MNRSSSTGRKDNLPPGWLRKIDSYGRSFYVDTQSGKSYWRKPVEVYGGLVIKSEEERRDFFKGIYSELTRRQRQTYGNSIALPSYLDLYKIANKEHINENKFGHFLRKFISKNDESSMRHSASNSRKRSIRSNSRERDRRRTRNANLANKASLEAKEYALKKKRQKELANQKRFGNTWSKSPKQVDIKSPSHYKKSSNNNRRNRSSLSFSSSSSSSKQSRSRSVNNSRISSNRSNHKILKASSDFSNDQDYNMESHVKTLNKEIRPPPSPQSYNPPTTKPTSLLKVVLNRTEEEKQRTSALRRAINNSNNYKDIADVNVSIDNGNKKTKDNISSPFVTSPFNETQVENHNEVENYSLGLDQNTQDIENSKIYTPITKITPSSTRPLRTSALNESPAVAINSYQEKSQPHNNKDIKKQLRVTYDAVQQMVAAEHAASSSIGIAEASKRRLRNAKQIIEAKVDEEFSRLYQVLAQYMASRSGTPRSQQYHMGTYNVKEEKLSNSMSMANKLERDSLHRENTALKERLHNAITIQENLRDSEANLKRELLSLRGK